MTTYPSTRIDVVVPVHGGWQHVSECLRSLARQTVPVTVIVVDDLSPDDTLTRVRAEFAGFEILANDVNRGFAASCNRGITHGSGEIVMLLNSDVVAEPDMAERILDAFDAAPQEGTGSVSPILLRADGAVDSFGITADRTVAGFVRYHGADPRAADPAAPPLLGPYGAAAAYRRAALDTVGLLDENIFMYGEELDLALRLRAAGWSALALAHVVGVHVGGASAGEQSRRQRYLSGFGRGYLLRVYGVLRGRHALQAVVIEVVVCLIRLATRADVASMTGRLRGWRAGRRVARRTVPSSGVDTAIGFRRALEMRRDSYWRTREERPRV